MMRCWKSGMSTVAASLVSFSSGNETSTSFSIVKSRIFFVRAVAVEAAKDELFRQRVPHGMKRQAADLLLMANLAPVVLDDNLLVLEQRRQFLAEPCRAFRLAFAQERPHFLGVEIAVDLEQA